MLIAAVRAFIIDMNATAANLQRECREDTKSPAQRCSHISPRNIAAPQNGFVGR